MPKEYSVNHIQILRLAYFAELRYLLTFSDGETDASLPLYGKGREHGRGGSQRYDWLARRRNGFLLYVGSESDDKEGAGPKSKAKYHARNGTYTDLGRKETPAGGSPHEGPQLCRARALPR